MRALQKIVRNGNSAQITIPRAMLIPLDWLPGESVILELQEDGSLLVRRPRAEDFVSPQRNRKPMPAAAPVNS